MRIDSRKLDKFSLGEKLEEAANRQLSYRRGRWLSWTDLATDVIGYLRELDEGEEKEGGDDDGTRT